jgi:hypothetical protein
VTVKQRLDLGLFRTGARRAAAWRLSTLALCHALAHDLGQVRQPDLAPACAVQNRLAHDVHAGVAWRLSIHRHQTRA